MSVRFYVPDRGDVVWLTFNPQAGHEQAGRRLALTIPPRAYNERAGLALFCPLTSQVKGCPFGVPVPPGLTLMGVVLADQVRNLDWEAKSADYALTLPKATIADVIDKIRALPD